MRVSRGAVGGEGGAAGVQISSVRRLPRKLSARVNIEIDLHKSTGTKHTLTENNHDEKHKIFAKRAAVAMKMQFCQICILPLPDCISNLFFFLGWRFLKQIC